MLSAESLHSWATQHKIADVTTGWVQNHCEEKIDKQLGTIAGKERKISKDSLVAKVVYVSLWVPYNSNSQESCIVVSVKVGYKQDNVERDLGMCKLFYKPDGTLDHDE